MTTLIDFTPSATSLFTFLAQLGGGNYYNIAVPWNPFGERWYIKVSDLSNNVILHRAIAQSGPKFQSVCTWNDGVGTAALSGSHNVRVGELANARISQTNTDFDGLYSALAIDPLTMTFPLAVDPQVTGPVTGRLDFPLDLLAGYGIGSLFFWPANQQFEF
jgi:hypothetical protein